MSALLQLHERRAALDVLAHNPCVDAHVPDEPDLVEAVAAYARELLEDATIISAAEGLAWNHELISQDQPAIIKAVAEALYACNHQCRATSKDRMAALGYEIAEIVLNRLNVVAAGLLGVKL